MVIVACLLAASSVAICYASYEQSASSVFDELKSAISLTDRQSSHGFSRGGKAYGLYRDSEEGSKVAPFELGLQNRHGSSFPIAVYEVSSDGSLVALSSIGGASISEDMLSTVAVAIDKAPFGEGALDSLGIVYVKQKSGAATLVAFADSSSIYSWGQLALVLLAVGGAVLLAMFAISIWLSRWALAPVRKAWQQQKRFISDASHELKTPLAVLAANNSILKKHASDTVASQSQWVESSETEIEGMRQLVDDMLFIASSDEGAIEEEFSNVDLSRLIEGELLQLDSLGFEKEIDLSSNIQEGVNVEGQKSQLDRLVRTLLENAFKYVPNQGKVSVSLSLGANSKPVFSVFNSGSPIPEEDLAHIFDRFYRVDKARGRTAGGHGLGLSIAKDIADANGATLQAESNETAGTGFIVAWH